MIYRIYNIQNIVIIIIIVISIIIIVVVNTIIIIIIIIINYYRYYYSYIIYKFSILSKQTSIYNNFFSRKTNVSNVSVKYGENTGFYTGFDSIPEVGSPHHKEFVDARLKRQKKTSLDIIKSGTTLYLYMYK